MKKIGSLGIIMLLISASFLCTLIYALTDYEALYIIAAALGGLGITLFVAAVIKSDNW